MTINGLAVAVWAGFSPLPALADAWSAGLNVRPELGVHPVRIGAGVERGLVDLSLVVDPMFVLDGQHDIDLIFGRRWCAREGGWGAIVGWRTSTIGLGGGTHLQQKLVIGVTAALPSPRRIRLRWALEAATVIVKHGAGLPTDWITFADGRDLIDLINLGTFLRIDYVGTR